MNQQEQQFKTFNLGTYTLKVIRSRQARRIYPLEYFSTSQLSSLPFKITQPSNSQYLEICTQLKIGEIQEQIIDKLSLTQNNSISNSLTPQKTPSYQSEQSFSLENQEMLELFASLQNSSNKHVVIADKTVCTIKYITKSVPTFEKLYDNNPYEVQLTEKLVSVGEMLLSLTIILSRYQTTYLAYLFQINRQDTWSQQLAKDKIYKNLDQLYDNDSITNSEYQNAMFRKTSSNFATPMKDKVINQDDNENPSATTVKNPLAKQNCQKNFNLVQKGDIQGKKENLDDNPLSGNLSNLSICKTLFASGSKSSSQINNSKKGDKKNVVKNFVKNYILTLQGNKLDLIIGKLRGLTDDMQLEKIKEELLRFSYKKLYFNNKLIISLIKEQPHAEVFKFYLENLAGAWLDNSLVQDKKSHREVLRQYIEATNQTEKLSEIIVLKKSK